ncbi:MAG: glycosyltransferase family 4 protein [Pseudomonadota bacterium]
MLSTTATERDPAAVVLVTASLQGGGAERVLSEMANYWAKRDVRVALVTWSGPETSDFYRLDPAVRRVWLDVQVPNTSKLGRPWANFSRVRRLRKLLSELRPDAVLSFLDWSNVLTILAAKALPMRLVVSERCHPAHRSGLPRAWRVLRKVCYPRADAVVAQTEETAVWLERKYGANVRVIPNALRKLPALSNGRDNRILVVGRLVRQKGFDLFLEAFAEIHSDFADWTAEIVGSGPEESSLLRLRDRLGVTDKVRFRGPRKDIESLMSRAGLVVQPSRFEGFPNVVLEAMGMGAPVISADCPAGPAEIIQDGVNGRLVPVDDVSALASTMAELMSRPELRARLGQEAVKVRQRFRQEAVMRQWEACLLPGNRANSHGDSRKLEASVDSHY